MTNSLRYQQKFSCGSNGGTDLVAANWFSPAGQRRGRLLGITDIVLTPQRSERDTLYKAGINPIANIPGQGIMLFGDKTNESRPSKHLTELMFEDYS